MSDHSVSKASKHAERPDFECQPIEVDSNTAYERPLSLVSRVLRSDFAQRVAILLGLITTWQIYAIFLDNPLLFPTFTETLRVFYEDVASGFLPDRIQTSLSTLAMGYVLGLACAGLFTALAVATEVGARLLSTLTAMFNPLPAIALLPLALIWFGLGPASLVFILIHSVLWAVALNTLTGFRAVPETLRMSGRNFGLSGPLYIALILIPAAFPSILAGMKIGWAFAWRTLVAAELIFGVSSRSGGIGWYIFEARAHLETSRVFAGLFVVIIIGLLVETVIFRGIEKRTVDLWGMQR